ncbi:signal recognition particle subunit SRP72 [Cylas formicarius]|uniref:signal recognition particle subunit SRP72 n=1 Tax=Cylas formicarius TaxID=197179 RepID=UPI0029585727|nr:signal recognition particle subunit SRP72 [Cylas formicarius]
MAEKNSKDKTIAAQYAELNKFGQNGEYERALKAANKILGIAPHEFLAFNSKIVCLIHLSKFEDAISQINKNPEYLQDLIFEKAYCYYRINKHEEALKTIEKSEKELDYRIKELKAQILYRLEHFNESNAMYQDVVKNTDDDYEEERLTNLYATMVYMSPNIIEGYLDEVKEVPYELCYNKACMLIALENYNEAEKTLKQCEKLCREKLEEDEDTVEEDIDIELALIRIQLGFVYHKQGRFKEAQQLYTSNLKLKLEDIALMAVASNNVVCLNKDQNLFDSKKKMKVALADALLYKLPSMQRRYIALNNAILNYYINHTEQCEKVCKTIETTWPELLTPVTLIRAMNLVKAEKLNEAINLLKQYKTTEPHERLYLNLCIAQLHLTNGNKLDACKVLENLGDDSYKPGIVGALTTLYLGVGDEATALKMFEKAVEFYKKNKFNAADLSSLWRQAADFHIRNGHPQVAANSLEELLASNQNDQKIIAQLVLACAQFDKSRALKLSKQLPSVKELSKDIDFENIQILAPVNTKKSPAARSDSLPCTPKSEETRKKNRKHKKRKGKLPKNYDSSVKPDPERWLPKYERTGYRKKQYRRTKDVVIKGSQGTSSLQAEQYDFSKYVDDSSEGQTTTVDPSPRVQSKGQHQKKGQQKKKSRRR